jgi:hypothetical protein
MVPENRSLTFIICERWHTRIISRLAEYINLGRAGRFIRSIPGHSRPDGMDMHFACHLWRSDDCSLARFLSTSTL